MHNIRILLTVAAFAGLVVAPAPAAAQDGAEPLPRIAFLARADDPVDALAAGAVAGALGSIVLLTDTDALSPAAAQGLADFAPDLVVIAGGTDAVSAEVEAELV